MYYKVYESFDGFCESGEKRNMTEESAKQANKDLRNVDGSFWVTEGQAISLPKDKTQQETWYNNLNLY